LKEFSEESLQKQFDAMSANYEEQYIEAGFPPKICMTIIDKLNTNQEQKHKVHVLDIGCGKGFLGEYLKEEGYMKTTGMDCSNSLLEIAKSRDCYYHLERRVFGQPDTVIPEEMKNRFPFVSAASILNNDGYDIKIFENMIDCC
jgi:predicted TPR repeat methyltransferase